MFLRCYNFTEYWAYVNFHCVSEKPTSHHILQSKSVKTQFWRLYFPTSSKIYEIVSRHDQVEKYFESSESQVEVKRFQF